MASANTLSEMTSITSAPSDAGRRPPIFIAGIIAASGYPVMTIG